MKNLALVGFFAKGTKCCKSISPSPCAIFAFLVSTIPFLITKVQGWALAYSRCTMISLKILFPQPRLLKHLLIGQRQPRMVGIVAPIENQISRLCNYFRILKLSNDCCCNSLNSLRNVFSLFNQKLTGIPSPFSN